MDDPDRLKLCKPCGLEKPVTEFYDNGQGYPRAICKACCAKASAKSYRKKYANNEEFRRSEIARQEGKFMARYWRLRPLDEGQFVRICNCHGKVCRVWLVDDTIRCAVSARPLRRFRVAAA